MDSQHHWLLDLFLQRKKEHFKACIEMRKINKKTYGILNISLYEDVHKYEIMQIMCFSCYHLNGSASTDVLFIVSMISGYILSCKGVKYICNCNCDNNVRAFPVITTQLSCTWALDVQLIVCPSAWVMQGANASNFFIKMVSFV